MHDLLQEKSKYNFKKDALDLLTTMSDDFITEVNQAIENGDVTPKSKRIDLIQCVAVFLHVVNHIAAALLQGQKPDAPAREVTKRTVEGPLLSSNMQRVKSSSSQR